MINKEAVGEEGVVVVVVEEEVQSHSWTTLMTTEQLTGFQINIYDNKSIMVHEKDDKTSKG